MRLPETEKALSRTSIALVCLIEGCATVNSGDYGRPLDEQNRPVVPAVGGAAARTAAATGTGLRISAGEIGALSSRYFGAVELTFENDTPAWVQIDRVTLDFGTLEANRAVLIPWGADIDTWERATSQRNAIQATNMQTALEVLALAGAIGRRSHHGRPAGTLGGPVEVGAAAALVAQSVEEADQEAERVERFPATHLLTMPIRIPPGLFTKRWILLYTAERPLGGCVRSVILGYETADHRKERVLLRFKNTDDSAWQRESCQGVVSAVPTETGGPGRTPQ